MMKTMELRISETLFYNIEQAAQQTGISMTDYVQQLLRNSVGEQSIAELERNEVEAYLRQPVLPGEFDQWEEEQSWGDQ